MNNIVCVYFASNPYKDFDGGYDKHYEESVSGQCTVFWVSFSHFISDDYLRSEYYF